MARRKKRGVDRQSAASLAKILEIPPDAMGAGTRIELSSNREIFIEGHKGILEYTDDLVRLNAGENIISISGKALRLRNLTTDSAFVEGQILSLVFN